MTVDEQPLVGGVAAGHHQGGLGAVPARRARLRPRPRPRGARAAGARPVPLRGSVEPRPGRDAAGRRSRGSRSRRSRCPAGGRKRAVAALPRAGRRGASVQRVDAGVMARLAAHRQRAGPWRGTARRRRSARRVGRGQQLVAEEDRVGPGEEAEHLQLAAHAVAAGAEADARLGNAIRAVAISRTSSSESTGGGHRQRRAGDRHQAVDRHALRRRVELRPARPAASAGRPRSRPCRGCRRSRRRCRPAARPGACRRRSS